MFVCIGMCLQLCVCARVCVHVCVCSIEICICRLCVQAQYVYAHECIKVAIENGMHLTGMLNGPVHGNSLHTVVCSYTHTGICLTVLCPGLPSAFCLQCFDAVGWAAGRASGL